MSHSTEVLTFCIALPYSQANAASLEVNILPVQQRDCTWATATDGVGKDSCWDSGSKSCCIVPPTSCHTSLTLAPQYSTFTTHSC